VRSDRAAAVAIAIGAALTTAIVSPIARAETELVPSWSTTGAMDARYGWTVGRAGDMNNDGYDDLLVGAPILGPHPQVTLFLGSPTGLPAVASEIVDLNWSNNAQTVHVAGVGDVDQDGYDDFAIGTVATNNFGGFALYGGGVGGVSLDFIVLENTVAGAFGFVVCGADVDGDDYSDVVVGEPLENVSGVRQGRVRVYRGGPTGLITPAAWTLDDNVGLSGFGTCVASAGDVNADGFDDLVVGSTGVSDLGRANLFLGGSSGPQPAPWSYQGETGARNGIGRRGTIAGVGDVDQDGRDDVVVGLPAENTARLFLATMSGLPTMATAVITGQTGDNGFGGAVAAAGDVNGDAHADILIGAPVRADGGGAAIYLGTSTAVLAAPVWHLHGVHPNGNFGAALASLDADGNGYPDIVVGAWSAQSNDGVVSLYESSGGTRVGAMTAQLAVVDDPHALLQGALVPGQAATGYCAYGTQQGDTQAGTTMARYAFDTAPHLIDLRIGGLDLRSDPIVPNVRLEVENRAPGQGADRFVLRSFSNRLAMDGVLVDTLEVRLQDPGGTTLDSEHQIQRPFALDWPQMSVIAVGRSLAVPPHRFRLVWDDLEILDPFVPLPSTLPVPAPVCLVLQARVTAVSDPHGSLQGAISPLQVLTGLYVYNSRSADSNALPSLGEYFHASPAFGMEIDAPGFVFRSDPSEPAFLMRIGNGTVQQGQVVDSYEARSDANLPPRAGLTTESIAWQLTDTSANATNLDSLPGEPPALGAFNGNVLRISGRHTQSGIAFEIQAHALSCIPCNEVQAPTSDVGEVGARRVEVTVGPNPFHSTTLFRYRPVVTGPVRIDIWDVAGRRVRRILAPPVGKVGEATAWDGRDEGGRAVAAGVYFYRMHTPDGAAHGTVVLVR
jgi:hypothetical protein